MLTSNNAILNAVLKVDLILARSDPSLKTWCSEHIQHFRTISCFHDRVLMLLVETLTAES
jgi:hypothetical protein